MAFADELERVAKEEAPHPGAIDPDAMQIVADAREWADRLRDDPTPDDDDTATEILSDLSDRLNESAPPYVYFGSHEGDGADFGWWPNWHEINEDRQSDELPSGDELPEDGEEGTLFLVVNERGNAELYRRRPSVFQRPAYQNVYESLWSVV